MVDDLSDSQDVCAEDEWTGLPTVPAKVYLAPQGGDNGKFPPSLPLKWTD